jgi:hypothetical protein
LCNFIETVIHTDTIVYQNQAILEHNNKDRLY